MNINNNIKSSYLKDNNIKNNKQKKQDKYIKDNKENKENIYNINNQDDYILDLSYDFSNNNNNNSVESLKSQAHSFMLDRENAKVSAKNQKESFDVINQCVEIANKIMNGDKVPIKDEQFLLKNDPAMYSRAVTFMKQNDDPKEYQEISEEPRLEEYLSIEDIDTSSVNINLSSGSSDISSSDSGLSSSSSISISI